MKQLIKSSLAVTLASLFIAACDSSDDDNNIVENLNPGQALVQTVAPDYTSSEVVLLDAENEQAVTGYYIKDKSDYSVVTYQDEVFHIGRYGIDTVEKYSTDALDAQIWSFSTQDDEDSVSRNPYTIAFASDEKAYLLRYGSASVWIINPQATVAEDFKIGELDLSSYVENNTSGTPRPSDALVHDGQLFISMQRLDDNWSPQTTYVAVFDTSTDSEVETNASSEDSVLGIPLTGVNPLEHSLVANNNELFVTSRDSYGSFDFSGSKIEAINLDDFSVREVVAGSTISANIQTSAIVSDTQGYFVTTQAVYEPSYHEISALYEFNPSSGEIIEANVADTGTEDINFITVDNANFLWLSIGSDQVPGVDIIDTTDNTLFIDRLLTDLNPGVIAFLDSE